MTLSLPAADPLEALMKVKVSRHVACTWTWGIKAKQDEATGEARYFVTLGKCHPFWEIFTEIVNHLPSLAAEWIHDMDFTERLRERWHVQMAEIEVDEMTIKQLYMPVWDMMQDDDD